MFILYWLEKNKDEKNIDFSMRKSRDYSWDSANLLWSLSENHNQEAIPRINCLAVQHSELIHAPKTRTLRFVLKFMQNF